jgi:hypothetical protein
MPTDHLSADDVETMVGHQAQHVSSQEEFHSCGAKASVG